MSPNVSPSIWKGGEKGDLSSSGPGPIASTSVEARINLIHAVSAQCHSSPSPACTIIRSARTFEGSEVPALGAPQKNSSSLPPRLTSESSAL